MTEKSTTTETSGNAVVVTTRILAGSPSPLYDYYKGFSRADEYVSMISRDGRSFAGVSFVWGEVPYYAVYFINSSGNITNTVDVGYIEREPCDVNADGSIALFCFEALE